MPSQKELNRIFFRAFTDGMTCAGLFVHIRLPGAIDFNDRRIFEAISLAEDPVAAVRASEEGQQLSYRYATAGLAVGTATFLTALGAFCYL